MRAAPLPLVNVLPPRLLAALTGASVRSAQRWRAGGSPRAATAARLRETDALLALLGRRASAAARRAWLEAPNPALGGDRPVERLARGDVAAVRAAARGYGAGDMV
ncbi:MAG TPA: antitoxin Xre/MbcA/ParS toxin-binding domain-containing protein [Candidatus Limnocylindria bacterium]|nr:antitoxin Xre/MbcA/ParS toxin-binding domain-containing protein [Candidatus Limnocylindria bacterium]